MFGTDEWNKSVNKRNAFNPFLSNTPFLYPPENIKKLYDFQMFLGGRKRCIGNEWVNDEVKAKLSYGLSI